MLSRMVWLFDAHRQIVDEARRAQTQLEILSAKYVTAIEDNKKLAAAVEEMQKYIANNPSHIQSMMDIFQRYQEQVLQDQPFPDNKIPDDQWLTASEDSRG